MLKDGTHEQLRYATTAMLRHDKNIRNIGDSCKICNRPGKANLPPIEIRTKTKRMLDGPLHNSSRNALCPIRGAQKIVNQRDIQAAAVSGDLIMDRCLHKCTLV